MKPTEITFEVLRDEIVRLGTAYPDYVYRNLGRTCSYDQSKVSVEGKQGCLVGVALQNLLDKETFVTITEGNPTAWFLCGRRLFMDDASAEKICDVQSNQDSGTPWGECIVNLKQA